LQKHLFKPFFLKFSKILRIWIQHFKKSTKNDRFDSNCKKKLNFVVLFFLQIQEDEWKIHVE